MFMAHVVGHNEGLNHRLTVALWRVFSVFNQARFFVTTILHGDNARYHFMFAGGPAVSTTASRAWHLRTLMFSSPHEIPHELSFGMSSQEMHPFGIVEAPSIPARRVTHASPTVQSGFIPLIQRALPHLLLVRHQHLLDQDVIPESPPRSRRSPSSGLDGDIRLPQLKTITVHWAPSLFPCTTLWSKPFFTSDGGTRRQIWRHRHQH